MRAIAIAATRLVTAIAMASFTASPSSAAPGDFPHGDVNLDGHVNAADSILVQRHLRDPEAGLLDGYAFDLADVAPLDSGAITPNGIVDVGDLNVLLRIIRGDLVPEQPSLLLVTGYPYSTVSGAAPAGSKVDLFVTDGDGTTVLVDSIQLGPTVDSYAFSEVPALFNGMNEYFVVATDPTSGISSWASLPQSLSHTYVAPTITSTLAVDVHVWTADPNGTAYTMPSAGLTVPFGATLILGPGVELEFPAGKELNVLGALRVLGAPTDKVALRPAATSWSGVRSTPAAGTTAEISISNATIENTSTSQQGSIEISGAFAPIALLLRESQITTPNANTHGVVAKGQHSSVSIERAYLQGSGGGQGIVLNQTGPANPTNLIRNTEITSFATCINAASIIGINRVQYSHVHGCNTGINIRNFNPMQVRPGNLIENNTRGISIERFSRLYVPPRINDSVIKSNGTNLAVGTSALDKWITADGNGVSARGVLDATRNYWGSEDGYEIADTIDDVADDLNDGDGDGNNNAENNRSVVADFTPFRTESGDLVYTYVSGRMDVDFDPGAAAPLERFAVGPMVLEPGVTATIPAGTTVRAFAPIGEPRVDIHIAGDLIAVGTSSNPIRFLSPAETPTPSDYWWGLAFEDGGSSELTHVDVHHTDEAIRVYQAEVSIDTADIRYFSRSGISLDSVADSTEVVDSTIDGTLDPSLPDVLRDTAVWNAFGIQVRDSYSGCSASPGTCLGIISGNTIQNLVTGIHVLHDSDPEILDNTSINNNIWGVWLQGDGENASNDPLPVLNGNHIYGSSGRTPPNNGEPPGFRYCVNTKIGEEAGANLCLSDYSGDATSLVLDATGNDWGTTDLDEVRNSVRIAEGKRIVVELTDFAVPGSCDPGPCVAYDPGVELLSAVLVDIAFSGGNFPTGPVIQPLVPGDVATISFYVHRNVDLELRAYDEDDLDLSGPVHWSETRTATAGSTQVFTWDGRSTPPTSALLPDGAYAIVIDAKVGTALVDRYDPPRNYGNNGIPGGGGEGHIPGDRGSGDESAFTGITLEFDSFANTYLSALYGLIPETGYGLGPENARSFSSRVTAEIYLRDAASEDCNPNSKVLGTIGTLIASPWLERPLWEGEHALYWDGRVDSSSTLEQGLVVEDPELSGGEAGFCVLFGPPQAMKRNHVIITGVSPKLMGPENSPQIEVLADPWLVDPTFEHETKLSFRLDRPADVNVYILPPGVTDFDTCLQAPAPEPCADVLQMGTVPATGTNPGDPPASVSWTLHGDPGQMPDTNELDTSADGPYTFAIEATSNGFATVHRGVLQVHGND